MAIKYIYYFFVFVDLRRKMQFLITAIVVVSLLVGVVSSCPRICICTDTYNGVNVDCSKSGLDSIPTDLPDNTKAL